MVNVSKWAFLFHVRIISIPLVNLSMFLDSKGYVVSDWCVPLPMSFRFSLKCKDVVVGVKPLGYCGYRQARYVVEFSHAVLSVSVSEKDLFENGVRYHLSIRVVLCYCSLWFSSRLIHGLTC